MYLQNYGYTNMRTWKMCSSDRCVREQFPQIWRLMTGWIAYPR